LMYEDKLREAQYAIADQQITPVQIWKLGDPASGYMPTEEDLADFRNLLLAGRHDPLFTIVSHGALQLDLVGYTGHLLPVIPEFEWVAKRIMVGLYTNESMLTGDGPSYSNAIIALKILQGRYQSKRDKIARNLKQKIFKQLSLAHEVWDTSQAELSHRIRTNKKPVVPGIEWNFKLDLTDESQKTQYLMQLREKTDIPMKVICEVLGLKYDTVKQDLKNEEGTVFDKAYKAARDNIADESPSSFGGAGAGAGGFDAEDTATEESSAEPPAEPTE